ncbi:MAG: phosphate signaling complex protein PhoU [Phycisphaerae bacterium]|jgi:phosphate transport system protein|nr:phosphate signaling complex protein PhoU [Phycisphaerae bacterium]
MAKHMEREIENLKKRILSLGAVVEDIVQKSARSIKTRDAGMAQDVIDFDIEIDQTEVVVEEECLKILALHQPVASDLRFIVAVLKINNDLERIGDLAVNIAERAVFLASQKQFKPIIFFDFEEMARKTQSMLKRSLDALVNADTELAREVCAADDEVDAMNREMYLQVQNVIKAHPEQAESLIHMLSASRHLERIADHATNIAEDVIYMIEGEIVRHRTEDYRKKDEKK